MSILRLSDIGSFFYKGTRVIHENTIKKEASKVQVGRVEKVLDGGDVEVNWGSGAAIGEYRPRELVIYDPY